MFRNVDVFITILVVVLGFLFSSFCVVLLLPTLTETSALITIVVFLGSWLAVFFRVEAGE